MVFINTSMAHKIWHFVDDYCSMMTQMYQQFYNVDTFRLNKYNNNKLDIEWFGNK